MYLLYRIILVFAIMLWLLMSPTLALAQNHCTPANMLIVLDNSNSMKNNNKLADANAAIRYLVTSFMSKLRFGLMTFCGGALNRQVVMVTKISDVSNANVMAQLPTSTCLGTPIKLAMEEARNYFRDELLPSDPIKDRPSYVILVTDGKSTDGDPNLAIQALRNLQAGGKPYDIRTYVIGFGQGTDAAALRKMAQSGGTRDYHQANDQISLQNTFIQIADAATKEICDDLDNNCNGLIDEDWPNKGKPCLGGSGCKTQGKLVCSPDKTTVVCDAGGGGEPEKCDGIDNNCDGRVDEDWPEKGQLCEPQGGDCKVQGRWICKADGSGVECSEKPRYKSPEICDGIDNDCNGLVDDGLTKSCQTACGSGIERCENGKWLPCDAPLPAPEICDGIDNDCNGTVDDVPAGECGHGICKDGVCVNPCRNGECPGGYQCREDYCIPLACNPACASGLICVKGQCVTPKCEPACEPGDICTGTRCIAGPCKNINCGPQQFCRDGQCFPICNEICNAKQKCVAGRCIDDPCADITCPPNGICKDGNCIEDLCHNVQCKQGEICERGKCQPEPCRYIQCPTGSYCRDGLCWSQQAKPPAEPPNNSFPDAGSHQPPPPDYYVPPTTADDNNNSNNNINTNPNPDDPYSLYRKKPTACACSLQSTPPPLLILSLLLLILLGMRNFTRV